MQDQWNTPSSIFQQHLTSFLNEFLTNFPVFLPHGRSFRSLFQAESESCIGTKFRKFVSSSLLDSSKNCMRGKPPILNFFPIENKEMLNLSRFVKVNFSKIVFFHSNELERRSLRKNRPVALASNHLCKKLVFCGRKRGRTCFPGFKVGARKAKFARTFRIPRIRSKILVVKTSQRILG